MIEEFMKATNGTWLMFCRLELQEDGSVYLGYSFPENEDGSSWEEYCELQEELQCFGYRLTDVYCEHDFIGGKLEKL